MKAFFIDIFEYHHKINQALLNEFEKHVDVLPENSFPTFCHNLNAHQIWNARILKEKTVAVFEVHTLAHAYEMDKDNFKTTMKIIDKMDLDEVIHYHSSAGLAFSQSIKNILFHVNNHHTHHRGQIISNFRQAGIPPLKTDFIFYKKAL
jgi:uncharacterized damage-inducible protein DinB